MNSDASIVALRRVLAATSERERKAQRVISPDTLAALGFAPVDHMTPAAVLLAILPHAEGASVLLTRRAEGLRNHAGQISLPGGRRDPEDASYAACALREAEEEIGLPPDAVEVIGYLDDLPTVSGFRVTPVVGVARAQDVYAHSQGEVTEVFEAPLALILRPDAYQHSQRMIRGVEIPTLEIAHGPYRIWGATAAILWDLCQRAAA